ncbi:hypothetical protein FSB08_31400 [Paraburkholderia sp. JPY432]|uniref:hypothetical protein n=1 Tax=Paraburkholderia TaxID=1822464 RepID=UPI001594E782|nr:hypothetical protein [Paraburkholderia youngii]NVH76903.1 hypothetical protein [Paraburkholderia youngii]
MLWKNSMTVSLTTFSGVFLRARVRAKVHRPYRRDRASVYHNAFYGVRGPENELSMLLQASHDALGRQPQVIALVAEARLRKTGILQEFCRWLNQFEDARNYWPDTLPGGDGTQHVNRIFKGYF